MVQVEHLSTRMVSAAVDPPLCSPSVPIPIDVPKPDRDVISNTENLQKQVGELQKALERNEREKRDRNIIIFGLEESNENCEKEVESMIEEKGKFEAEDVQMSNVRRMVVEICKFTERNYGLTASKFQMSSSMLFPIGNMLVQTVHMEY